MMKQIAKKPLNVPRIMCLLRSWLASIRTSDSKCFPLLLLFFLSALAGAAAADALESGFAHPPDSTKPWCYWYWISDNISREGITRDLEAMQRVGIGEAFIGNIYLNDVKTGDVKALS
ncbi:MAG TPA: glycosyl hydrolase, partial [Bacillota bacterium]|nr:glycosyl hydrolase [Bacillota bacterium]